MTVGFDLLVPGALAGPGRRSARVPNQDHHAIGRADGLEMTILDREKKRIEALDSSGRSVEAYVVGPAALLCAKAYKLYERLADSAAGRGEQVKPKDAGDVWRRMAVTDPGQVRTHSPGVSATRSSGRRPPEAAPASASCSAQTEGEPDWL